MADISQDTRSQDNLLGALCYLFGWVTGAILWFSLPKSKKFVRFHAMQSIIFFVILLVIFVVLSWIWVIGWIISAILGLATFVIWIMLMVKAYQGLMYKLPFIGDLADKWSSN
jgi:uncharacterized membrane protein